VTASSFTAGVNHAINRGFILRTDRSAVLAPAEAVRFLS
jgi:hypothetical protein